MKILRSQLKEMIQEIVREQLKSENWSIPPKLGKEDASVIGPDDTNEAPEIGSSASTTKGRAIIKQMHDLVTKQLKFKTVEDIQPLKGGGVTFIFGDKAEASKMASYLKKKGVLGSVTPLVSPRGRTMVTLAM